MTHTVTPRAETTGPHRRPTIPALLFTQFRYANHGFWRQPVAAFFTLVFPLSFLVVLSAIVGNAVIDQTTGLRFAQFVTPAFAVFGVCMASYVSLAAADAYARESGVLKRLHGTPVPPAVQIGARILSAVWVSMIAVIVLVGVGVTFYGVQIVWRTVPAVILTLLVGIACFAALGLAVAALAPSAAATQAITNGSLVLLAFVSGMFAFGDLPDWVERVGDVFPLRHFMMAVSDAFNPYLSGSGFAADHLAVMAAWGVVGAVVAIRWFRWEPRTGTRHGSTTNRAQSAQSGDETDAATKTTPARLAPAVPRGHRTLPMLVWGQIRYAMTTILRDPMSMFFAIVFPVLMLVFFGALYGSDAQWGGLPLPQYAAAAFAVYGIAVMAYVNLAGTVAEHRSRLILKRLRGTPLPSWAYLAGRFGAAVIFGLTTVVLVFAVGILFFDVSLPVTVWPAALLAFVLGIVCFASLGLLVSATASSPTTVIAIALATLLPLSFVSDIFIASGSDLPPAMSAVGWTFPLRHVTAAAVTATSGGPIDAVWWGHVGVVLAWLGVSAVLARLLFRWEPRS